MEYVWTAYYNDGTKLQQYEENEHLFSDINQEELKIFKIENKNNYIILEMNSGMFILNGEYITFNGVSGKDLKYRLIYFRRNRVTINTDNTVGDKTVESFVGFQTTDEGINKKVMISVKDNKFNIHVE